MPSTPSERRVVCEDCGEVIETETIGGPGSGDRFPELGTADRLVPAEECGLCADEERER